MRRSINDSPRGLNGLFLTLCIVIGICLTIFQWNRTEYSIYDSYTGLTTRIVYSHWILSDPLYALLVLALFTCCFLRPKQSLLRPIVTGIFTALAYLTKPAGILYLPMILGYELVGNKNLTWKRKTFYPPLPCG